MSIYKKFKNKGGVLIKKALDLIYFRLKYRC